MHSSQHATWRPGKSLRFTISVISARTPKPTQSSQNTATSMSWFEEGEEDAHGSSTHPIKALQARMCKQKQKQKQRQIARQGWRRHSKKTTQDFYVLYNIHRNERNEHNERSNKVTKQRTNERTNAGTNATPKHQSNKATNEGRHRRTNERSNNKATTKQQQQSNKATNERTNDEGRKAATVSE